jgi:hypothetical protein
VAAVDTVVIIRGQARTWNWIKHRVLASLDPIAGADAHWLWISPQTHTVTQESLAEDFGSRQHRIIEIAGDLSRSLNSYTSLAHYDLQALDYLDMLRPRHVIFTRPDLLLRPGLNPVTWEPLDTTEIRGWYPSRELHEGQPTTSDFYCRAGLQAGLLLAERARDPADAHHEAPTRLSLYVQRQGLKTKYCPTTGIPNMGSLASHIVRPQGIETALTNRDSVLLNDDLAWSRLSPGQQAESCRTRGIDPRDYGRRERG